MNPVADIAGLSPGVLALLGAVPGAIVGSFLGAALVRWGEGRSVVRGRSACDHCGAVLAPAELIPIASFLAQRGRCRRCTAPIDRWQFACEIGGAAAGAIPWLVTGDPFHALAGMMLGWLLLLLGLLDARHLWLPLRLVGVLAAAGAGFALFRSWQAGWDRAPLLVALLGGLVGYAMLALVRLLYRRSRGREGMGAGDPPLLAAIGLWLGPLGVIEVVLAGSIAGIFAAALFHLTGRRLAADTELPLGTCLAVAAWPLFMLQGFG